MESRMKEEIINNDSEEDLQFEKDLIRKASRSTYFTR